MVRMSRFVKDSKVFAKCCELAGIPATSRQASKFRRGEGEAYRFLHKTRIDLVTGEVVAKTTERKAN